MSFADCCAIGSSSGWLRTPDTVSVGHCRCARESADESSRWVRSGGESAGADAEHIYAALASGRRLDATAQIRRFRLLVETDQDGRERGWSRRGANLTPRIG